MFDDYLYLIMVIIQIQDDHFNKIGGTLMLDKILAFLGFKDKPKFKPTGKLGGIYPTEIMEVKGGVIEKVKMPAIEQGFMFLSAKNYDLAIDAFSDALKRGSDFRIDIFQPWYCVQ
jgi:hypothetical protein